MMTSQFMFKFQYDVNNDHDITTVFYTKPRVTSVKVFIRLILEFVPSTMDELPIEQSRSQPVNPSHVTINGLAHYCTHNASVNNSI